MERRQLTKLLLGIVVVAVVLAVGIAIARSPESRANELSDAYVDARDRAAAVDGEVVAIVNNVPIERSLVVSMQAMQGNFPVPPDVDGADERSIVDWLIGRELLRQEAERRNLRPSHDDIVAAIRQQQASMLEARDDPEVPAIVKSSLDGWERIGHPIEGWESDEYVYRMYYRMLQDTMLINDETAQIPRNDPDRMQKSDSLMAVLVDQLRDEATIEVP